MIKEKLQSVWGWAKRNVKKLLIGLGIIGVALASGTILTGTDTSFEDLPNVGKEQGIYRITYDEYSDVEIKDQDMPEVKLRRWGDETYIKVSYPDFVPTDPKQGESKLKWGNENKEVHLYQKKVGEANAFEFEIVLKEKPATNKIVFNIETKGLVFYYQSELTQEEKDEGNIRPENVVGSYAAYHETQGKLLKTKAEGEKYKTGKAFHIYRPWIEDAEGHWVWGELHIDKNILTVTIPQDFIDNAVYPVRVDPTFGKTDIGGTEGFGQIDHNNVRTTKYTLTEAGTITSVTLYTQVEDDPGAEGLNVKLLVYENDAGDNPEDKLAAGGGVAVPDVRTWVTDTLTASYEAAADDYHLAFAHDGDADDKMEYWWDDGGDADQTHYDNWTYCNEPATAAMDANQQQRAVSIYATYTTGRRIIIIE
jgi:hypothetical protein